MVQKSCQPVEVGSISHYLPGFKRPNGGPGFLPSFREIPQKEPYDFASIRLPLKMGHLMNDPWCSQAMGSQNCNTPQTLPKQIHA